MKCFSVTTKIVTMNTNEPIETDRLYSFSEAAKLIPSCRKGHINLNTLHRWRLDGRFQAICRTSGRLRYWFLLGSEILKLISDEPIDLSCIDDLRIPKGRPPGGSAAKRREWAKKQLVKMGILPKPQEGGT